MNIGKDPALFWKDEPPGHKTSAIRWLQKQVMEQARQLPHDFNSKEAWEEFKVKIRRELPGVIGIPQFPALRESTIRARIRVGEDAVCERVDVYVDEDYAIPTFVFSPLLPPTTTMPALVWNPGWPQDKWDRTYELFAVRMAHQGFVVLIPDHAPFGETTPYMPEEKMRTGMTHVMSMGHVLGISQLALRSAETKRCGEYLRSRKDVDAQRVAVAGLCQGGQDTWLTAALDDGFCAAAPFCSETTFAVHMTEMTSYFANADSSPFPFGVLKVCDVQHLHAAIAPRPLLVRSNLPDQWWPISGFDDVETLTRKIYRFYAAEDKVDFRAEVNEHNLTGPFADALEAFLLKYLKP